MTPPSAEPDGGRIPIIKLWSQLLVPLQGDITDQQASRLQDDVLREIQRDGAMGVVIDVSGLWIVDSHLCAVLAQLAMSARMMGTRTVLSGVSPDIAMTLQTMGVGLEGIATALGLEEALELLGVEVTFHKSVAQRGEALAEIVDEVLDAAGPKGAKAGAA